MKSFFAVWRTFQDTVVGHPLCRYTILPAGVAVAACLTVWLTISVFHIGLFMDEDVQLWEKIDMRIVFGCAWLACVLLTCRWLASLAGLLLCWYYLDSSYYLVFSLFVPVLLIIYDWRSGACRRLSAIMLGLCGFSVAVVIGLAAWLTVELPNERGLLMVGSLDLGLFVVFFDLLSRISRMPETALARRLSDSLGLALASLFANLLLCVILLPLFREMAFFVAMGLLVLVGYGFSAWYLWKGGNTDTRTDTDRHGQTQTGKHGQSV